MRTRRQARRHSSGREAPRWVSPGPISPCQRHRAARGPLRSRHAALPASAGTRAGAGCAVAERPDLRSSDAASDRAARLVVRCARGVLVRAFVAARMRCVARAERRIRRRSGASRPRRGLRRAAQGRRDVRVRSRRTARAATATMSRGGADAASGFHAARRARPGARQSRIARPLRSPCARRGIRARMPGAAGKAAARAVQPEERPRVSRAHCRADRGALGPRENGMSAVRHDPRRHRRAGVRRESRRPRLTAALASALAQRIRNLARNGGRPVCRRARSRSAR